MRKINVVFICFIAICLSSCAVSRKVQYDNLVANIEVQGTKSVAIAALDHRTHVLKDGKPQDFVGYLRAGVGIPYPIGTKSKKPLASDVANSINETLANKGYKCSVIGTSPTDTEKDVTGKLKATGSEVSLLFLMNSWWTDTYMATLLNYDVTISIYDKNGNQLSTRNFTESKKGIGVNVWGTEYQRVIPDAFKKELEKLLNDPDIKKSLQ
jgi:hypothetical protein